MDKITTQLTDSYIDTVYDQRRSAATLPDGTETKNKLPVLLRDKRVKGLQLRIGKHRLAWQYYNERSDHGSRKGNITCKALGRFDPGLHAGQTIHREAWHVSTEAAREAAMVIAGKVLEGTAPAFKRAGVRFAEAFEDYCLYLEEKAAENGKPARWARNVRKALGPIMLSQWAKWTLGEMSERPEDVASWHKQVARKHGPTSANHCARIIRAMYRQRAGLDRSLNLANLPTSSVKLSKEKWQKRNNKAGGLAAADFPAWHEAWQKIDNRTRKGFHLTNLLTGARPGELARTRWRDFDATAHVLTIGDPKMMNTYEIPTTPEIEAAINLAATDSTIVYKSHGKRTIHKKIVSRGPDDPIFPGCERIQPRNRKEVPVMGHALRRTFEVIATDHCRVEPQHSDVLMGHVPEGNKKNYLPTWLRKNGPLIVEAQHTISRTLTALLQGNTAKPAAKSKLARVAERKRAA